MISPDTASRVKVVVASETAARRIFGTPDAVGKSLITIAEPGFPQTAYQVVGVVKDSKYQNLREKESELQPVVFAAEAQNSSYTDWDIVTHSSLPFASVAKAVEGIALKTHPGIRLERSVDFRSSVIERLARERLLALSLGILQDSGRLARGDRSLRDRHLRGVGTARRGRDTCCFGAPHHCLSPG